MKFAMLYSCGKDSALALHRMIREGHRPVCLIVTCNSDTDRSWFHGLSAPLLDKVEKSLGIALLRCACTGVTYEAEAERCLVTAREMGAQAAAFGDIDIGGHLAWNRARCDRTGLECMTPLWREPRERLVYEMLDAGFRAVVKCVNTRDLDASFLGKTLDRDVVREIAAAGADICGENGEYHTFVYDGPIFHVPVPFRLGETVRLGAHAAIDLV